MSIVSKVSRAKKIAIFGSVTSNVLSFLPLEYLPIFYAPYDCVYSQNKFVGESGRFFAIDTGLGVEHVIPVRNFFEGEKVKAGDPVYSHSGIGEVVAPMDIAFTDLDGNPVEQYPITGIPSVSSGTIGEQSGYVLLPDNIYDAETTIMPGDYSQVIWGYGVTVQYGAGVWRGEQWFNIYYVPRGTSGLTPPSEAASASPVGWMRSDTLEEYNGEAVYADQFILTALYSGSGAYEGHEHTVHYTYVDGENQLPFKTIVLNPYSLQSDGRYMYIAPRYVYGANKYFIIGNDFGDTMTGPRYGFAAIDFSSSDATTHYVSPIIYPILKNLEFGDKEIIAYWYEDYGVLRITGAKEFDGGVETTAPFDIFSGHYVNWGGMWVSGQNLIFEIPIKHDSVANRGLVYRGRKGSVVPSDDDGSIIPILYYMNSNLKFNFGKLTKIFPK